MGAIGALDRLGGSDLRRGGAGGPMSTTRVASTTILGAGAAQRINLVRRGIAAGIFWALTAGLP